MLYFFRYTYILVCFFYFICFPLLSTSVIYLETDQMCQQASSIVIGTIISKESQWTRQGRTIDSVIKIKVDQVLKNNNSISQGNIIEVINPGGKIAETHMKVPGVSDLIENKSGVFFLIKYQDRFAILTFAQGHFPISEEKGHRYAARDPKAPQLEKNRSSFAQTTNASQKKLGHIKQGEKKLLSEFKQEIEQIVNAQKDKK